MHEVKFNVLQSRVSDPKKAFRVSNLKFDVKDLHRSCNSGIPNPNFNTDRFLGPLLLTFGDNLFWLILYQVELIIS